MKNVNLRRVFIATSTLLFSYLLFIGWFSFSTYKLINDAKYIFSEYKKEGSTSQIDLKYQSLLNDLNRNINIANSPFFKPLIFLTKYKTDFITAVQVYDQIKPMLPSMPNLLGSDSPKEYLVAFQNSAEARGTGGIIGAFAILKVDKAQISILQVGSNSILRSASEIPIKLPKQYSQIYRSDPAIWQNSNMSPHFPYGAQIWLGLWRQQFGKDLDGVITLDPIVLSSILRASGPVEIDGHLITSDNVVKETLSDAYLKFEKDNVARKQYLVDIINAVSAATLSAKFNKLEFAKEITKPLLENRILIYSTNKKLQKNLSKSVLSGNLLHNPKNEYRLVVQNTAGNKMDFYLDRTLKIVSKSCGPDGKTEVSVKLKNIASVSQYLPNYVKGRLDLGLNSGKNNSTSLTAFIFGPLGKSVIYSTDTQKNEPAGFLKSELNRQAVVIPLELKAQETRSFNIVFQNGIGPITTHIQPLVRDQKTEIVDSCK